MINDYTQYVSGNDFLNQNADVKTTKDFDYNSFYRATVLDNNDPEKLGRVKVQIATLGSNGVWAYPGLFSGMGYQTGAFILPPKGSVVFVTFEYSDEHRPIYFGGLPSRFSEDRYVNYGPFIYGGASVYASGDDIPTEYTGTQTIVYKSPTGNIIYIDDSDLYNAIVLKNQFGQQFSIAREYDPVDDTMSSSILMKYDDNNYLELKEGSFKWISDGVDVPIGNLGNARTILWDEPDE